MSIKLGERSLTDFAFYNAAANGNLEDDQELRSAAYRGRLEVVKYLIEVGVDIHAGDYWALRFDARYGYSEIVRYLCEVYLEECGIAWCLTSECELLREFALKRTKEKKNA